MQYENEKSKPVIGPATYKSQPAKHKGKNWHKKGEQA
jgi:hypothetical protein